MVYSAVFRSRCASQGKTEEDALNNLRDALTLHFTPPVATVLPNIQKIELEVAA